MKERPRPLLNLLCWTSICHEQRLLGVTCRGEVHRTSVNLKIPHIVKNHVGNDWLSFFFFHSPKTKNMIVEDGMSVVVTIPHYPVNTHSLFASINQDALCGQPSSRAGRPHPSRTRALIPRHTQLQRQRNRQEKKRMERIRPTYTIFVREQSCADIRGQAAVALFYLSRVLRMGGRDLHPQPLQPPDLHWDLQAGLRDKPRAAQGQRLKATRHVVCHNQPMAAAVVSGGRGGGGSTEDGFCTAGWTRHYRH